YAGVQEAFGHLQQQDVSKAVEGWGVGTGTYAGLHQAGPGPVVELPVGDLSGRTRRWSPISGVHRQRHQVLFTPQTLLPRRPQHEPPVMVIPLAARYRHADLRLLGPRRSRQGMST